MLLMTGALLLLIPQSDAYAAADPEEMKIEVNEGLSITAEVDDSGSLVIKDIESRENFNLDDPAVTESREVMVALAAAYNGWYWSGYNWFYFVNGKWLTGWQSIGGAWYKFDGAGRMLTGWQLDSGVWYYLRTAANTPTAGVEGAMVTGWALIGEWYKFDASGGMITGWQIDSGEWYYLKTATNTPSPGPQGSLVVNTWAKINNTWYYFLPGGQMKTGWLSEGGNWYFLANSEIGVGSNSRDYGAMVKGLRVIGLYEYYFCNPDRDSFQPGFYFPEGAMCHSLNYSEFFGSDGIIVYAMIDSEGHVRRYTLMSELLSDEDTSIGQGIEEVATDAAPNNAQEEAIVDVDLNALERENLPN